jgi:hypothetical protein
MAGADRPSRPARLADGHDLPNGRTAMGPLGPKSKAGVSRLQVVGMISESSRATMDSPFGMSSRASWAAW